LAPHKRELPGISILHSFALRQLLKNSSKLDDVPLPLRIPDDWEEKYIERENLKCDPHEHLPGILPNIKRKSDKIKEILLTCVAGGYLMLPPFRSSAMIKIRRRR
jgi:hypothetical protein